MMDAPTRVWERATLHRLIFGAGSANDLRSVDTRISRARRHVLAALGGDPIRTVRGVGYALVAEP
jgi:two-component system phosphate regulon response regulator PhoB